MCRFARNVRTVCVCGGITSLGFSVDWTSSSLSRVDLSGLSWHRSCPGHLWEAAVVWAPAYSAVYLCLCLAIKRRVLQYRVIFFTPWKHSRVPGYTLARVTTSTNVDDTASLSLCQGIPQYPEYCNRQVKTSWVPCVNNESLCVYLPKLPHQRQLHTVQQPVYCYYITRFVQFMYRT